MIRFDPEPIQGASGYGRESVGLPPESTIKPQEEMPRLDAEQLKQQALQKRDEVTQAVKSRASDYFDRQKEQIAGTIEDVSGATRRCATELQQTHPRLGEYTNNVANQMDQFGRSLRQHDAGYFMHQVQDFAKQRPGLFLGGALLLGFAATRFLKTSSPARKFSGEASGSPEREELVSAGIHNESPITSGTQFTI